MADTTIGTSVAIASPDLEIIDGQITTTSNQVAEHFGKEHKLVMRAIRNLLAELPEWYQCNFAPIQIDVDLGMGRTRKDPAYRITRDGFTLLAMGFTGKEALQWKLSYITAFNKMEAELLARTTRPANPAIDYTRISPAQAQGLKELVHSIVDAKAQGFAETWARLHKKFRVNSYLELPATRFEEARDYLLGKLPEAPQQPQAAPQPTAFTQALAAARENALSYMNGYRQAVQSGQPGPRMDDIPGALLEGIVAEALMSSRFLAGFDHRTGQMHVQLVPKDASVFSFQSGDFGQAISAIPTRRLPELQDALSKRVARHLGTLAH